MVPFCFFFLQVFGFNNCSPVSISRFGQLCQVTILSSHINTELENKFKTGDEVLNLLHFTSLTVTCSISAASSTQQANSLQVLHHSNTDKSIIYQYCTHISPYPKMTFFEKLLLNYNPLKEYGFSPAFQFIHQLCLFPPRK